MYSFISHAKSTQVAFAARIGLRKVVASIQQDISVVLSYCYVSMSGFSPTAIYTAHILYWDLPVPYVVEMADGYPPIPCPGKVGVATETTGVANDWADWELFILWFF